MTARAKGCSERQVLYSHVFRNAMLIVIAGFPGAFIHAFFSGSLLIETIFSLDGLGLLGFESVLNRDYPVVFATLFIFSLVGLVVEPDLRPHLHVDRSAHRFRGAGGLMTITAPQPIETTTQSPLGEAVPITRHRFALSPLNRRRWQNFKANRRGYWSFWIFLVLFFVSLFAEFIANDRPFLVKYRRRALFPGLRQLFRDDVRRRFRNRRRLSRSLSAEADRGQGRHHALAADPLFLRHPQSRSADAGAVAADLDADRRAVQGGGAEEGPERAAATSNTTGSAPTTRAATWWRG